MNDTGRTTTLTALRERGPFPLIGTILVTPGAEWTELCGSVGFDFVCVDHMVTSIDWAETGHMLRGAAAYGASGWVRLSSYPWQAGRPTASGQSAILPRDVLRALAVGADAVTASVDHPDELAAMMAVRHDHHRKLWDGRAYDGHDGALPSIFPLIESRNAFDSIADFAALDGVEAVFLGLGDLTRILGLPQEVEHPDLSAVIRDVVETCAEFDVMVMTTAGYRDTPGEVADAVGVLGNLGVGAVWIPYPSYLTFRFYQSVLRSARPDER